MRSILRADFFRMWKSKSTIIGLIVCCVAPLIINLLYLAIAVLGNYLLGEDASILANAFQARTLIGTVYSTSNNMGFLIPMFAAIFICSDINSGMLRNKIIAGKPRKQIFLSYLLCSGFLNVIYITAYASLMAAFSLLFFKYGATFDGEEVINLVYYIVSGTIAFIFLSTVSLFFSLTTGNSALSIVFTILFGLFLGTVTTIITFIPFKEDQYEIAKYFLAIVPTNTAAFLDGGVDNTGTFIVGLCSMLGFGTLNAFLTYVIFAHKELK